MKPVRIVALCIFLLGIGFLVTTMYRVTNSGEVLGTYALGEDKIQSPDEFLGKLLKPHQIRIGKDLHPKFLYTEPFSFFEDPGEVRIDLIAYKKMQFRGESQFLYATFILLDEEQKEIFRKEDELIKTFVSEKRGLNSKGKYFVGVFKPELSKKYKLAVGMDNRLYTALSTRLEIEIRRDVESYNHRLMVIYIALFIIGAAMLAWTRPKS